MGPAQADVVELAAVAQGDTARLVDTVGTDAVVALSGDGRVGRRGLGAGAKGLRRRAAPEGPVGALGPGGEGRRTWRRCPSRSSSGVAVPRGGRLWSQDDSLRLALEGAARANEIAERYRQRHQED